MPDGRASVAGGRPPIARFSPRLRSRVATILGCHGNPDRCPSVGGRRAPICARCTGFLIGNFLAVVSFLVVGLPTAGWTAAGAVCLLPAVADGGFQAATSYRSTNPRRLATGALGGFGQLVLLGGFAALAAPRIAALLAGAPAAP